MWDYFCLFFYVQVMWHNLEQTIAQFNRNHRFSLTQGSMWLHLMRRRFILKKINLNCSSLVSRLKAPHGLPWTHLKCSMKIKRRTLSDASSSCATRQNMSVASSIKQTRLNDNNSHPRVSSKPLIEDEEPNPTATAHLAYKYTCSSTM